MLGLALSKEKLTLEDDCSYYCGRSCLFSLCSETLPLPKLNDIGGELFLTSSLSSLMCETTILVYGVSISFVAVVSIFTVLRFASSPFLSN